MPLLEESTKTISSLSSEVPLIDSTLDRWFSGYVDVSNMAVSGDTIKITAYVKISSTGTAKKYRIKTLVARPSDPIIFIPPMPSKYNFKVVIEQTAGTTGNTFDYQMFVSEQSV